MTGSNEIKTLVVIMAVGFGLSLSSLPGSLLGSNSLLQLLLFRAG
jgi:hypothetical protein